MEAEGALVPVGEVKYDLSIARAPKQVLAEAQEAANALQTVIHQSPSVVRFNNKVYLAFEHWQTCGRFYGVTARIASTEPVEMDGIKGFIARAEAIHSQTGQVISAAESMCMNDEPNWKSKPLFQLRSMAQTRACAKALRNVLAWVVVLAGYQPTPAEEMEGESNGNGHSKPIDPPKPKPAQKTTGDAKTITMVPTVVNQKDGGTEDKPWTKTAVCHNSAWYSTFDQDLASKLISAKAESRQVKLSYVTDAKGFNNIAAVE